MNIQTQSQLLFNNFIKNERENILSRKASFSIKEYPKEDDKVAITLTILLLIKKNTEDTKNALSCHEKLNELVSFIFYFF